MASPVAHSLIGFSIGMAGFLPRFSSWKELGRGIWQFRAPLFICAALANAPDIDYLFGIPRGDLNLYHQTFTHTAVWVILLALVIWLIGWPDRSLRSFLFVLALPASHLAADFFTADYSEPYGMMLFWPFDKRHMTSPVSIFSAPMKASFSDLISRHNVLVVVYEMLITLPVIAAVAAFKLRRGKANGV